MIENIGRYQVQRELGRGGMATVYLAYDPRFKRQVAVKVLPRQFTHDPKFLERFEHEAVTIAALEHTGIVPVYDFGEHDDAPYLVMRYMPGGSLAEKMDGDHLSLDETARILEILAPALDKAHEKGIIHRDLKPGNVLFDEDDKPFLADFGIARMAEATHTMTIVGTPAYMSPEQVRGKSKLDGRSDLYALGVILFEMFSGRRPYVADTPSGQMFMHVMDPIPDVLALNPGLPAGAQAVINKAMAKDREERYNSAAGLAAAVRGLLGEDAHVPVPPASHPATPPRPVVVPPVMQPAEEAVKPASSDFAYEKTVIDSSPDLAAKAERAQQAPPPAQRPAAAPPPKRGFRWLWWVVGVIILAIIGFAVGGYLSGYFSGGESSLATGGVTAKEAANEETGSQETVPIDEEIPDPDAPEHEPAPEEVEEVVAEPPLEEPPPDEPPEEPAPDEPPGEPPPGEAISFLSRAREGEFAGSQVEVFSFFGEYEVELFRAAMAPFEEMTGISVIHNHIGSDEFDNRIRARVAAGDPPDIAMISQPKMLAQFVADGEIMDVREYIPEGVLHARYAPGWLESATFPGPDGQPVMGGVWRRAQPKDLVWFPRAEFEAAGYRIPQEFGELIELNDTMVANGQTPWCIGIESGPATGWMATDWVEMIMLRIAPAETYDAWVAGELPFNSPEVRLAAEIMAEIWFNPEYVLGGREQILDEFFGDSPGHIFENPPACWLHKQGPWIQGFFPDDVESGVDYDVFPFPAIDPAFGQPQVMSGHMAAMFNERPEVMALMGYMTTGASVEPFIREDTEYAPHQEIDLGWYSTEVNRRVAEIMLNAEIVRFDASDMMPGEVGAGAFWTGMVDFVNGADLEAVLQDIDAAWPR